MHGGINELSEYYDQWRKTYATYTDEELVRVRRALYRQGAGSYENEVTGKLRERLNACKNEMRDRGLIDRSEPAGPIMQPNWKQVAAFRLFMPIEAFYDITRRVPDSTKRLDDWSQTYYNAQLIMLESLFKPDVVKEIVALTEQMVADRGWKPWNRWGNNGHDS